MLFEASGAISTGLHVVKQPPRLRKLAIIDADQSITLDFVTTIRTSPKRNEATSQDEDNLALEISEDKRLVRLGLNPDGNPIQRMLAVHRIAEALRK